MEANGAEAECAGTVMGRRGYQVMMGSTNQAKGFGSKSRCDGLPLGSWTQEREMVRFTFAKVTEALGGEWTAGARPALGNRGGTRGQREVDTSGRMWRLS